MNAINEFLDGLIASIHSDILPLGQWVETLVRFLTSALGPVFAVIRAIFEAMYNAIAWVLLEPPFVIIVLVLAAIAWLSRGLRRGWILAVGTLLGLLLIVVMEQWDNAMATLALVLVASLIAVIIAIPLGILAAKSDVASSIIRPVLDFLQTMPAFVYLIPALILFRVGVVPGIVATIIFALAPGVRMTELGIRGVDKEVIEAGKAFGATPSRILAQVQLPLAMPSIMAGVNQVIMLSLSMVVIAGMVGAGGLGADVVMALNRIDVALGFEAGVSVVILAIILDRITSAFSKRNAPGVARRSRTSSAPDDSGEAGDAAGEAAADLQAGDQTDDGLVPAGAGSASAPDRPGAPPTDPGRPAPAT